MRFIAVTSWWAATTKLTPPVNGISSRIFRNVETGEEVSRPNLPIGALYCADRSVYRDPAQRDIYVTAGADGNSVILVVPTSERGGKRHWYVDRPSRDCCKRPNSKGCWARTGSVGQPVTVAKCDCTCTPGDGLIAVPGFRGKLSNGRLEALYG